MDWLKLLAEHAGKILFVPLSSSVVMFIANLMMDLSDGNLSDDEMHKLVQGASSSQIIILLLVMVLLKIRR